MIGETIALVMIVRNEEARLAACLESAKAAVDEIIVVDTGSTDGTLAVARRYTEQIYTYRWEQDFAAARNFALDRANCAWVLCLDADERLDLANPDELRRLTGQNECNAFLLPLHAVKSEEEAYEHDCFQVLRLFRSHYRFRGRIHEYLELEADRPATVGQAQHPVIRHIPVSPAERSARRRRNLSLLRQAVRAEPDDPCLQYYLGSEWMGLGKYAYAISCLEKALKGFTAQQIIFRSPAVRNLLQCYKLTGNLDVALMLCRQELTLYPGYCDLCFDAGVLLELRGDYAEAMRYFRQAAALYAPPPGFVHTDGSNSYLSYYHLGHCAEKLGRSDEAAQCYEQALDNSCHYYYPLYSLICLKLSQLQPAEALAYLEERRYLSVPLLAEKMGELFWLAGYPALACQCLERHFNGLGRCGRELLFRCQLYGGKWEKASRTLASLRQDGCYLSSGLLADEILLALLRFSPEDAWAALGRLWRRPDDRALFLALFHLYKACKDTAGCPPLTPENAPILLMLYRRCHNASAGAADTRQRFALLAGIIRRCFSRQPSVLSLLLQELEEQEHFLTAKYNELYTVKGEPLS